ncbi:MAG: hypothetical protein ACK4U0_09585 [Mesorhizobium sp.]
MKALRLIAAATALAALAGCTFDGPRGGTGPITRAPSGVEGDWVGTDGVAISRFTAGRFETYATDTGNKLAEGNYVQRDARTIDINLTSLIRQTTSSVACSLVTPRQMNCTSSAGSQFVLVRRGTA